jgi:hypothetical protein
MVYGWIIFATVWEPAAIEPWREPYNLQAQAFRIGQTKLPVAVPVGLQQLADPYDPVANAPYRLPSVRTVRLHDLSLYHGELYLYFGVTPVLVLFEPWLLLTGKYFPEELAVLFFCSVGFLLSVWLYGRLASTFFPTANRFLFCGGVLALGFVSGLPTLLLRPSVYEVAISCAHAFAMLTLVFIWRAIEGECVSKRWLALASLAFGLAAAARPSVVFGAIILFIPIFAEWRNRGWRERVALFAAAFVPIGVAGVAVLFYNASRFGNPFEFGQRYQLAGVDIRPLSHLFNPDFLAFNFRLYFWEPVRWTAGSFLPTGIRVPQPPAGYLGVDNPYGILTSIPFVVLAAALLSVGQRGNRDLSRFRQIQVCLGIISLSAALTLCAFSGASSRYEVEFLPALVLMAALGFLAWDKHVAGRKHWQWISRSIGGLLLFYSVVVGLLIGASTQSAHVSIRNRDLLVLLETGKKWEAVKGFEILVRYYPKDITARANLGTAYYHVGQLQEAVLSYQQALMMDPLLVDVYNNLGATFERLGRLKEARRHFKLALELRPDDRDVADNLARVERQAAAADGSTLAPAPR